VRYPKKEREATASRRLERRFAVQYKQPDGGVTAYR
jgi:hypothetical protein